MIEEASAKLSTLLNGKVPEPMDLRGLDGEVERRFAGMLNQLIAFIQEIHDYVMPLSRGQLSQIDISPGNILASPFKELHSRLLHLTWQAEQVAKGDYSQRIDFMGEFSEAFNSMVASLEHHREVLLSKIEALQRALSHISKLEGILPICANCKKIRLQGCDPYKQESWTAIEAFISKRTEAQFSHSICPECMKKLYPGLVNDRGAVHK